MFSGRIVGGFASSQSRYSYGQVSLQNVEGHSCGASLVAPDMLLSACHCASSFDKTKVGLYNLNDNSSVIESRAPKTVFRHPGYNESSLQFDVMLIELSDPILSMKPIRVNNLASEPMDGDRLTVMGWGATDPESIEYPELMHEVEVVYLHNDFCASIEDLNGSSLAGTLFDDMMCAFDDGKDACFGDSGGPLVKLGGSPKDDVQVGIVSWGLGCAGRVPGVYHRVSDTYPWLRDIICNTSVAPPDYFHCDGSAASIAPSPFDIESRWPIDNQSEIMPTLSPTQIQPSLLVATATPTLESWKEKLTENTTQANPLTNSDVLTSTAIPCRTNKKAAIFITCLVVLSVL